MTTIEDIAKKANTSIATVSRVLNNKEGFSEETRQKVLQAMEETGYESNAIARSLKKQKTNTIGVVIPNISSMLSNDILNGIEEYAHAHDYSVIVSYTYSDPKKVMQTLKTFNEQRVDGILFTSDYLTDEYYQYLERMNAPVVLVATEAQNYSLPFVKVNDVKASYAAVDHLIQKGHTNIGMLSGPPSDPIAGAPRIEGYKQALKEADIEIKDSKIVHRKDFSFDDGKATVKKLLDKHPDTTAIFAASDELAIGALKMAHEEGIAVPEELSIIGYDNLLMAEMVWPGLTTLAQPLQQMGYEATKMLVQSIQKKEKNDKAMYIPYEIIERDSVKALS